MATRSTRESEAHDKDAREKTWRPQRDLEAPPPGFTYRWIRESMMGTEDRANVSRRLREGFELVRGSDLPPEWQLPTMDSGRNEGVVYCEGLLLAKIPTSMVEQRTGYYAGKAQDAKEALDNTMFNESRSDGRYVRYEPSRDSRVSFGKN
jgi:hypothetical protein